MNKSYRNISISTMKSSLLTSVLLSLPTLAATSATIDLKTQKFIGGVSNLDRTKYFNIHMTPSENKVTTAELNYLVNDLNVGFGRQFWSPFSSYNGDAPYPADSTVMAAGPNNINNIKSHANYAYASKRMIITEHPKNIYVFGENPNLAADYAVSYFKHYFDNDTRPLFYEPMNEPFVHAGDFATDQTLVRSEMTNFFKTIGQKFDQNNIDTKVIGYSSAWPSMELWDFDHFNGRMKMFMDVAGPHLDSFSIHPYDGVNVTGADNERSGSNLESLLDLIETYSQFKWNIVKPVTISEYGGIESGYGDTYTDLRAAQSLLSQNKMLMQLLNRQDRLLTSIPFNTGKAAWHYNAANNWNPYGAAVLRPDPNSIVNGQPTNFFWTKRIDIYRLWADVKGKRVKVESDNPDIQLNAFVDGNKAYIALNSLANYWETVNLDFVNSLGTINQVRKKRLVVRKSTAPTYEDVVTTLPASYSMEPGETVVLELTFTAPIAFDNTLDTKHYYAPEHLVSILANQTNSFNFNGVSAASGKSVIRMSIGRVHGTSFQPTVTVNGTPVSVNTNWAGGDQASRGEFFGVIEIPVDNATIRTNNLVNVTFPDAGGRIASMVLQVNNDSETSGVVETATFANALTTIPSGNSYNVAVDYSTGVSRDVVVELWQNNAWLGAKTVTVNGTGQAIVTVPSNKATINGETGYLFKVSLRPVGGDWTTAIQYNQMAGIVIDDNVGATNDDFAFSQVIAQLPSQVSHVIAVDYSAVEARDVVVELWQNNAWLAQNSVAVNPGTGTVNVPVTLTEAPTPGATGYIIKGSIRPTGGDWTTNLATANQANITIAGTTPPTTYTSLTFKSSGKCLDNSAGSAVNGNQQQQWQCFSGSSNQSFLFEAQLDGWWTVKNKTSLKCLDKTNSLADGAVIHQWACDAANDNQLFKLIDDGAGYFQLQNKHSDKCFDLAGGNTASENGVQVVQNTCSASTSQKFSF